jgi:sarcosine oxidase, subunit alpha
MACAAPSAARSVTGVEVAPLAGGPARRIDCDLLAVSGGWNPAVHLHSQSRGTLRWDEALAGLRARPAGPARRKRGGGGGAFGLASALAERGGGGRAALAALGLPVPDVAQPQAADEPCAVAPLWAVPGSGGDAFVDLMNDVTVADLALARREGYGAIEHAKRYTTGGMALDQGKTGGTAILGVLAGLDGAAPGGTTTFRSPYTPVDFGVIAGGREGPVVLPYRHTPLTAWHIAQGAVMYEAGARWRRPGYYPRARRNLPADRGPRGPHGARGRGRL